ncbi:uncharacterized protein LOC142987323 [Anticarsia gemmatalis]|uniref:uncharacterized protein LOC142987323 n=1 Tax=Anticarsia gemmatalis TaxID=129554 RepID=UPI003F77190D
MDTENVKHHKHPNRNKSKSSKRDSDVLVVPPDILKKLGISIANSLSSQKVPNTDTNVIKSTRTVNDEEKINISTTSDNEPNESSILETASLMRRSVFLSPTFVPTVANVISGEVEISNNLNCRNSEALKNLSFKNGEVTNGLQDATITLEPYKKEKFIINYDLINDRGFSAGPIVNGDLSEICLNEVLVQTKNGNNIPLELNAQQGKILTSVATQDNYDLPLNGELYCIPKINGHFSDKEKICKKAQSVNDIVYLNGTTMKVQQFGNKISSKVPQTPTGQTDNNFTPGEDNANQMQLIENNVISLNGVTVQIEQLQNNSNILNGDIIQVEESESRKVSDKEKVVQISQVGTDSIPIKENGFPIEQLEKYIATEEFETAIEQAGNDIISIVASEIQMECCSDEISKEAILFPIGENIGVLDGEAIEVKQSVDTVFTEETANPTKQDKCNILFLDENEIQIKQIEADIISLEENNIQIHNNILPVGKKPLQVEEIRSNDIFLTESNLVQNLYDDNVKDLIMPDGTIITEFSCITNVNEDSLPNSDSVIAVGVEHNLERNEKEKTETRDEDMHIASQVKEIEPIIKDIQIHNNCDEKEEKLQNGCIDDSSTKLRTLLSEGCKNNLPKLNPNVVSSINKTIQKVNIISEEVISASGLKELRSQSPIVSLTQVPLNTLIPTEKDKSTQNHSPKIISENECDNKETSNLNTNEQTENEIKSSDNDQDMDLVAETVNSNVNKPCLLENGDLKNNNNILGSSVSETSTNLTNHESSVLESCDALDSLDNSHKHGGDRCNETENTNDTDIPMNIDEGDLDQNVNIVEAQHTSSENVDRKDLIVNGKTDESICIDDSKSDCSDTKMKNPKKAKKKSKKKKSTEDKIVDEINGNDHKALCDAQLKNILKSSKENGTSTQVETVKEIADIIKKYAHIYNKDKKIVKEVPQPAESKTETISSKTNLIKSKLCIQGVEKPGGNRPKIGLHDKTELKTYTREKKQEPKLVSNVTDAAASESVACNTVSLSDIDINSADVSISQRTQDFCLCYDFGRLDPSEYDNSYEHIHFMVRETHSSLETIFSIYNDDVIYIDRSVSDEVDVSEPIEQKADTSNICWHNYVNNQIEKSVDENVDNCETEEDDAVDIAEDKEMANNAGTSNDQPGDSKTEIHSSIQEGVEEREGEGEGTSTDGDEHMMDDSNVTTIERLDNQVENAETAEATPSTAITDNVADNEMEIGQEEVSKTKLVPTTEDVKKVAPESVEHKEEKINNSDKKTTTEKTDTKREMPKRNAKKRSLDEPAPTELKTTTRKRKLPEEQKPEKSKTGEPPSKKNIKCGVCEKLFSEDQWDEHVTNKHFLIAWRAGQTINIHDQDFLNKLQERLKAVGSLKCSLCNTTTKKFNKFITHLKNCMKQKEPSSRRASTSRDIVTCGVCQAKVEYTSWIQHIGKEHNYLAWVDGQNKLNVEDEEAVGRHLQNIITIGGGLICHKCGLVRKRAKLFLAHIETCDGSEARINDSVMSTDLDTTIEVEENTSNTTDRKDMTCGVCKQEVPVLQWTKHIGKEHNYLAWEHGKQALDLNDEEAVRMHLLELLKQGGGILICYKCGASRKRVHQYLSHVNTCAGEGIDSNESEREVANTDKEKGKEKQKQKDEKKYICGVCNAKVPLADWNEHIGKEHNYLAWRVGTTPLDLTDEDAVKEHLLEIIRSGDGLICYKCGLNRRRVKLYLTHVQTCDGTAPGNDSSMNSSYLDTTIDVTSQDKVTCAVCNEKVKSSKWISHIGKEHKYLAWQQGKPPLDLNDMDAVKAHLLYISRSYAGLVCNMCRVVKKYPKSFLQHIKECTEPVPLNITIQDEPFISSFEVPTASTTSVVCGVCNDKVPASEWKAHLEDKHEYLAWIKGRPAIDLDDQSAVLRHLVEMTKYMGGLKCKKCGLTRKYAKSYLSHIDTCGTIVLSSNYVVTGTDPVECAVCSAKVDPRDWRDHAMKNHYNVAWVVGAPAIDINNPYGVESYIKEYQTKNNNKLICKSCGISRISAVGFYAHIITCGKTEEETEMYKSVCEICNNKYLRIYKSQHMTMHREQEYALERKIRAAKEKQIKQEEEDNVVEFVGGRRKAAEKAKTVIEKYTSNTSDGVYCPKCGFSSDIESEMTNHVCVEAKCEGSDSDESVELDNASEEEDTDTDIDSNISDEEREARDQELTKSKKHGESTCKILQRLPYQIRNLSTYMRKSAEEFIALHMTKDTLFEQWRTFHYEAVTEANLNKCMPPLEQSCKVKYDNGDIWLAYKRFEAQREKDIITMFMGGCIQSMCWVPACVGDTSGAARDFLAVVTHLGADTPRHVWRDKHTHNSSLLQIWDCGNLIAGVPQLAMGISLDAGTIWAIDWCPSGARDLVDLEVESLDTSRLGLCAAACANGAAYIFPVPYPSTMKDKDQLFYTVKPVVELRLTMGKNRTGYQATAIKWSTQKGHAHIVVGYSDGIIAYYDLNNDSPLLKSTENNVTVLYPYFDERIESMCIEDVDMFPSMSTARGAGVVAAGSVGGAGAGGVGPGSAGRPALQAHAAAARVLFPPHWPAALLAGDDNLVSQAVNELEWRGAGRRVGGMRSAGGCAWCGRVVGAAAPLLRLKRTHPAYTDLHRQVHAHTHTIYIYMNELEWRGAGRRVGGMRSAGGCAWCGRVVGAAAPLLRLKRTHPAYTDLHRQVHAHTHTIYIYMNELEWRGAGRRVGGMRSAGGCAWCGRVVGAAAPLLRLKRTHPAYTDLHRQVHAHTHTIYIYMNELEWRGAGRRVGGMRSAGGCAWCGRVVGAAAPLLRLKRTHPAYTDLHRQVHAHTHTIYIYMNELEWRGAGRRVGGMRSAGGCAWCGRVVGAAAPLLRLKRTHPAYTDLHRQVHAHTHTIYIYMNELEWRGAGRRVGGMRSAGGCAWCGRVVGAAAPLLRLKRTHPAYTDLHRQVHAHTHTIYIYMNELEWRGAGRRVGGMRSAGGCAWCGRVVGAAAPLLRLKRTHPAYTDLHRQVHAHTHTIYIYMNELEWRGAGRRVGGMRSAGGCAWCGRVVGAAAPLLRLKRTHPAYTDLHRQVIATIQMIPFGKKRKRKNDELSMIKEPLTYTDAVEKYGIEFKPIIARDKATQQKLSAMPRETFPERFPLSDVTAIAFCPTARNHHKLAVATHAGLIFIINV